MRRSAPPADKALDFDAEGVKLLARLNLQAAALGSAGGRLYNNLDQIWQHPVTGARVYVGNLTAASSRDILDKHNIRAVLNCQEEGSKNFFEGSHIAYMRFPISQWWRVGRLETPESVLTYFGAPFSWVADATAGGASVLIHCLAGAHRAGTTGVAFMMWAGGLDRATALPLAQRIRSIIDPIGMLGDVLGKYDAALGALRRGEVRAPLPLGAVPPALTAPPAAPGDGAGGPPAAPPGR